MSAREFSRTSSDPSFLGRRLDGPWWIVGQGNGLEERFVLFRGVEFEVLVGTYWIIAQLPLKAAEDCSK